MLGSRIATALVGAPLLLLAVWLGGPLYYALIGLLGGLALWELHRMLGLPGGTIGMTSLFGVAAGWYLAIGFGRPPTGLVLAALAVGITTWRQVRLQRRGGGVGNAGIWFASTYVGFCLGHFPALRGLEQGLALTLLVFLATWAFDTAAYFAGTKYGVHKMAPRLSPGKSWEGALAGSAAVLLMAMLLLRGIGLSPGLRLGIGVGVIIFGQLGDLFESSLKRLAQVKDAGTILPGHGGVLDRFDSLMFSVPVAYYFALLWSGYVRG